MKVKIFTLVLLTFLNFTFADEIYDGAESMVASGALLKRSHLKILTKQELKILIKVVDARHGKTYNNSKLNNFFRSKDWYTPGGYSKTKLSMVDKANTRTLKAVMMIAPVKRNGQISLENNGNNTPASDGNFENEHSIEPVVADATISKEPISGNVVHSKTITQMPVEQNYSSKFISLNGTSFICGQKIILRTDKLKGFDNDAFFAVIPSNVDHGTYSVNYKNATTERMYVHEIRNNKLILYTPFVPGNYTLRFSDKTKNKEEIFSISISAHAISGKGPALMIDKKVFRAGEIATVRFIANDDFDPKAWIGIVPSKISHGNEKLNDKYDTTYKYLKMADSGIIYLKVPNSAGKYDFRMNENDNGGREVAYISFKVVR